jgi:hypothetical protein
MNPATGLLAPLVTSSAFAQALPKVSKKPAALAAGANGLQTGRRRQEHQNLAGECVAAPPAETPPPAEPNGASPLGEKQ